MAMTTTEARDGFADICNRVAYSGERIVLHRRGKDIVAIVPLEVLRAIEALEDRHDVAAARKALKEPGRRPWSEVRGELGLDEPKAKKSRRKPSRAKAAKAKKTRRRKRVTT